MRNIPVNTQAMTFLAVSVSDVKVDRETGEVKTDRESGEQLHQIDVVAMQPGERPEVLRITTASKPLQVEPGVAVTLGGLTVSAWEVGGRSGLAFRAASVQASALVHKNPATPSAPSNSASSNGSNNGNPDLALAGKK